MTNTDTSGQETLDGLQRDPRFDAANKALARGAVPYSQLRTMSEDDLIFYHDVLVAQTRARVGIDYYLNELARRDAEEATNEMIAYTKRVTDMTRMMAWLTIISLVTTIVAVRR